MKTAGPLASDSVGRAAPLWRLLQATARVVQAVREGRSASAALDQVEHGLRPGVQALSFAVLRQLGTAQALCARLARRQPPVAAASLLCSALALACRAEDLGYDPHTLVDQTVEAAKRNPATARQADFINACLRRFLRERDSLLGQVMEEPAARWNHPPWWVQRLRQDHPQRWQAILEADGRRAPMTLRVNIRRSSVAACTELLSAAGIQAQPVGRFGLELRQPRPVQDIPGFAQGWWSVQDAAAQLAAPLLLDGLAVAGKPLQVLDACAAPGGKTAHLLEWADCQVTALDIDPLRCERMAQNLDRLGLRARVIVADAAQPEIWRRELGGALYDAILLDAPCTASGIVRRRPDAPWLRREADIAQSARTQELLLRALWPLLKSGGRLLYCTCSVFLAEGAEQVQSFVANNSDAVLRPAPGQLLPQSPVNGDLVRDNPIGNHDGFFYALLEKLPR